MKRTLRWVLAAGLFFSFAATGARAIGEAREGVVRGQAVRAPQPGGEFGLPSASPLPPSLPQGEGPEAVKPPVEYVIQLPAGAVARDAHLSWAGVDVQAYQEMQSAMLSQIETAMGRGFLASFGATPIATYKRIDAATVRVDGASAPEFAERVAAMGYRIWDSEKERRFIIPPVPVDPQAADPAARAAVTMEEALVLTKAKPVIDRGRRVFGAPEGAKGLGRLLSAWAAKAAPQPPVGVIDSGADKTHPLLKVVKAVINVTSGPNVDDIGHGSWVTSMILNFAPWLRNLTHYKTFVDGGATLDDILQALTRAGNDGNIVISNSWGSSQGDPDGPDSQLVRKLAEEGHILVFAAGNEGPGPDTVGSPAIVYVKDPKTGAVRVLSVAAADRLKKIARFSSRGPGSRKTRDLPDYPKRPDLSAVGYNIEGAWPEALHQSDRVDPVLGPLKAISGTSMSTPNVGGALALLATLFDITVRGEKLDQLSIALLKGVESTGQGHDNEGEGFLNVEAAYAALEAVLKPVVPGFVARWILRMAV